MNYNYLSIKQEEISVKIGMDRKNKYIGVFGSCLHEQNQMNFLSALRDTCIETGYTTIAFSASYNSVYDEDSALGELRLLELFKYIYLDCLIILTETIKNPQLIDKIVSIGQEKQIPVFSIDGTAPGCYNMPLDYKSGFRSIVRHVIKDHGRKRINMLAGFKGNSFSEERIDVYKEVLEEYNIPFEEERLGYGDFWDRPSRVALQGFIDCSLEMPDAIVCANDSMAITACAMLAERGFKVPEDIIVTGFDGTQNSKYNSPTITTCTPDYKRAIDFIILKTNEAIASGKVEPCDYMIGFDISKCQSCGCEPNIPRNHTEIITALYNATGDSSWHTLAMNNLVTSLLDKCYIEDIAALLPDTVKLWNENFRFACIKSELTKSLITQDARNNITGSFSDMTTILYMNDNDFDTTNIPFNVKDFIPSMDKVVGRPGMTLIVRLLNSGKQVYGYTVDGIDELNLRNLQRCNEFDMFLSHSINTVLHNYALNKAYEEIATLSIHDPMTGIYNRRGFFSKLNYILDSNERANQFLHIVFIDMDGLKGINDNYGHKEGDFAITSLALAIANIDIPSLLCARFGGDEFICAFFTETPGCYTPDDIRSMIAENIRNMPDAAAKKYPIDFSIGVLSQMTCNIKNIDDIILSADKMMYVNKISRRKK